MLFKKHKYIKFKREEDIINWQNDFNYCSIEDKEQINIIRAYSKIDEFNVKIRSEQPLNLEFEKIDKVLTEIANDNLLPTPIVVYRGIDEGVIKAMNSAYRATINIDNNLLLEKAYMSTSLIEGSELNTKVKLKIFVPAETPAIYIGKHSVSPEQTELLLGKGMVLRKKRKTRKYIELEVLPSKT